MDGICTFVPLFQGDAAFFCGRGLGKMRPPLHLPLLRFARGRNYFSAPSFSPQRGSELVPQSKLHLPRAGQRVGVLSEAADRRERQTQRSGSNRTLFVRLNVSHRN